jgi:uncharacterized metal-binding protein YceD (DUF177 family)
MMKVNVRSISNQGRTVRLNDKADWCVAACSQGAEGETRGLSGELELIAHGDHVEVQGHFSAQIERCCDRCNEPTDLRVEENISLRYYPQTDVLDKDIELSAEDLGVGWYEDGTLVLGDVFCEIVALHMPDRVLCLDATKCDMRLLALMESNQVDRLTGHPAFAALKGSGSGPMG